MATQLAQISAAVGFVLPLVIQFIQKENWPAWIRTVVGIAACVAAAIVTAYAQGTLNVHNFSTSVIVIFTLTKLSYLSVYKPAGLAQPKIKA